MNKILLIILLIYTPLLPVAQNNLLKGAHKHGRTNIDDTLEVVRLNKLAASTRFSNFDKTTKYGTQALQMARRLKFKEGEAFALRMLGFSQAQQSNYTKSREYYKQSLKLYQRLKDTVAIARITNDMANGYSDQSSYIIALKLYQKALKLLENIPDKLLTKSDILTNIGTLYDAQNKLEESLKYYQKALYWAKKAGNAAVAPDTKHNIAYNYFRQKKYAQAQKLYEQNLPNYQKVKDRVGVLLTQGSIGICQCKQQQITKGIAHLQQAIEGLKQDNQKYFQVILLNFLGECYLIQQQFAKSKETFIEALDLAKKIKQTEGVIKSLKYLSALHKQQGNFKQALVYHEQYQILKDSVFDQTSTQQLLDLQVHYETDQKEKALLLKNNEIALLKKNKINKQLQNQALIGLLITISIIGSLVILLLRVAVNKKKAMLKKNNELYQTQQRLHQARLTEEKLIADNLQKTLDLKNQQLSSKALHIIQKNEMLQKVREDLKKVNNKGKHNKELYQIMQTIDYSFSLDKDWTNFFSFFEEIHSVFFDQMKAKAPNLSPQDLRLCALIKLRFNSKEISSILGIALNSVSAARYRLRKKFNIPQDQRLSDFIAQF